MTALASRWQAVLLCAVALLAEGREACAQSSGVDYARFRSDSLGLRLAPLREGESAPFVLEVRPGPSGVEEVLLEGGKEVRRLVRSALAADGTRTESEYRDGRLQTTRVYDLRGRLLEETDAEGRRVMRYAGDRLEALEAFSGDGRPLYRERYRYTPAGELREVERTAAAGGRSLTRFVFVGGRLESEWTQTGTRLAGVRYDAQGRPVSESETDEGGTVWERVYAYRQPQGTLERTVERRPVEGWELRRIYDASGRLSEEERVGRGAYRALYTYDAEGRRVRARLVDSSGAEEWVTRYGEDGRVAEERQIVNGVLAKVRVHTGEGEWYEDLYRGGRAVLRVRYRGGRRIGEESLP